MGGYAQTGTDYPALRLACIAFVLANSNKPLISWLLPLRSAWQIRCRLRRCDAVRAVIEVQFASVLCYSTTSRASSGTTIPAIETAASNPSQSVLEEPPSCIP